MKEDMEALPPGRRREDKFYIGFFKEDKLAAIMDFILDYPQEKVVHIGLFMVEKNISKKGVGTLVIQDFLAYFRQSGYCKVRLAVDEGNPQSSAFWRKNGFEETGERFPLGESAYLVMECGL
ncbi:MAG: GNAT family N-acetyltransferase [Lachnospiraceae bacterium]|nr:GNAT family N-acetyltransferase [Lachnospiraceae bacterium]